MGIYKKLHIEEVVDIIFVLRDIAGLEINQHHTARVCAEHHVDISLSHTYGRIVQKRRATDEDLQPD